MTRPETVFGRRQFVRTTAALSTGDLAHRMEALANAVTECPEAFTVHHAAMLRNACQVAQGAAELIEMEIANERSRSRHTG